MISFWRPKARLSSSSAVSTQRSETIQVDGIEQEILGLLSAREGRSTQEIATAIRRSRRATRIRLAELPERGLESVVGSGLKDPKRRYFLSKRDP